MYVTADAPNIFSWIESIDFNHLTIVKWEVYLLIQNPVVLSSY